MSAAPALLVRVLREPGQASSLDIGDWELLVRQAGTADMLASLSGLLEEHGLLDAAPLQARAHLRWAVMSAASHARGARHEVAHIAAALEETGLPLILLKGGAYAMAGLDAGRGRLFSDIDILVPKQDIDEVEGALMLHGWVSTHHDAYDQRYYREWMHEIPPMVHVRRSNAIDVHHAILPETAFARPDPALLRAAAVPVTGHPGLWMLAAPDMFLHSAVHLFAGGEFEHGLRDLFDLHRLASQFGTDPGFWEALPARARILGLERPLFYALRYISRLLGTPVPAATLALAESGRPNAVLLAGMDALFLRALAPPHPSCGGSLHDLALFMLYVRGNWLRMPPLLLARHLFHKAFITPRETPEGEQAG